MTIGINLLPWRKELRLKKERHFKIRILVIFGVSVFILSVWHMVLWRQIDKVIKQMGGLQQQLCSFEQRLQDKDKNKQQQQQLQKLLNNVINLEKQRLRLVQIFTGVHRGISANSQLTQLVIKNDDVKLFGKTDSMFGITQLIKIFAQVKPCAMPLVQKINRQDDEYNFVLAINCDG